MRSSKMSPVGKNVVGNKLYTVNASKINCFTIFTNKIFVQMKFSQISPQRWFDVPFWSINLFRIALLLLRVLRSLDLDGWTCRSWKPLNHGVHRRSKWGTVWKAKMRIDLRQSIGFWENKKGVQQQPIFRWKRLLRADYGTTEWMLQARPKLC